MMKTMRDLPDHHLPVSFELADGRFCEKLWLPFPAGRHPETDAVAAESRAWLEATGLLRPNNARAFERARFAELAGLVYWGSDREGLRLAADFIAALFVLDDLLDDARQSLVQTPAAARRAIEWIRLAAHGGCPVPAEQPWVGEIGTALADITRRLAGLGCPLESYLRELDVYFDGVAEETRGRGQPGGVGWHSVSDYGAARVAFSAVYACVELGLAARGRRLSPSARELSRLANLSVSWVNDVYSWPKERAVGERSNLVAVLTDVEGLSEREALTRACRLCDEVALRFASRAADTRDSAAIELLAAWMRGNGDWHLLGTERYREHLTVVPHDEACAA